MRNSNFSFNFGDFEVPFFNRFLKILVTIAVFALSSNALVLDCTYSMRSFWQVSNAYTCTARVIIVGDLEKVAEVSQNHLAGRNNSDVAGLNFANQAIGFLPFNIEEFFPNLLNIEAQNSFDEVSPIALRGFPKLQQFDLNLNRVRKVEHGLFANNPDMRVIRFGYNPVRHVAQGVFDHLKSLHILSFYEAQCHSGTIHNDRAGVELLILRISVNCPPTFEMTVQKLLEDSQIQRAIDQQIADRINPLTWSVFLLGNRITQLEERVSELEGNSTTFIEVSDNQ